MLKLKPIVAGVAAAFGTAGLFLAMPAFAQQTPQPPAPQKIERVEVTGTNIKRVDTETATPITVITREEIERSGATTFADIVRKLSVANAGSLSGVEFSGFTPGAATISLRGLGGQSTLILINGRRIAPYGITGFQSILTSINSLPASAIDRIDILKDGASAIYGSEAIAGVVNIILRRDYNGLEAQATYTTNSNNAMNVGRLNLTGGIGDIASDKFNLFGVYEYLNQAEMLVKENKFYPTRDLRAATGNATQDFRSVYSVPGNVVAPGPIRTIPGAACDPKNERVVGTATRCLLDTFDYNTLLPETERHSLMTRAALDISSNLSGFAEVGFSRSTFGYQFDPQFYFNDDASGLLFVSGAPYGLAGTVGLAYRAGDIGPRKPVVDADELRLLTGLKGSLAGWDFDTAVGHMAGKVKVSTAGLILIDEMESALASGQYVPGRANSAAVIAQISPPNIQRSGKSTVNFVDGRVSTEFGKLPGGAIGFAAGFEHRREKQSDNNDDRFVTGQVFGFGSLPPLDYKRTVNSVFGEFSLPVLPTLEAQVAARYDQFKFEGAKVTSTTPKLGIKWTAAPTFVVRGTYAEGFRAPNGREVSPFVSVGFFNGIQDPVRCPVVDPANPDCSLSIQANVSGSSTLENEKSKSYTLGFVLEPVKDVSVTVDYWDIKRRNEITSLDLDYLLANQTTFASLIRRDATGSITDLDLPYINLSSTRASGVDLDLRVRSNLGEAGKLGVSINGVYIDRLTQVPAPGANLQNFIGFYGTPRFRSGLRVTWEKGPWTTEYGYTHVDGYSNKFSDDPSAICSAPAALSRLCDVSSWGTHSIFVGYKGIKNLDLGLAIDNVKDQGPPFDYRAARNNQTRAWNPEFHSGLGRTVQVQARYRFK
jgi:iron complex outermembrane recepter protein